MTAAKMAVVYFMLRRTRDIGGYICVIKSQSLRRLEKLWNDADPKITGVMRRDYKTLYT
jgi:hypothetical protein